MTMKIFAFFCCVLSVTFLHAQTWDGSASTDWNTPANWNTNAVPLATGNVTIPNTANKPVLANNVIINNFSMDAGSGLNFNGFTLTSNGAFDINGATLTNSNGATDISITLNGTGTLYLRQSVINDHIIINHNSTSGFYEGYQYPNTFNGNTTFNSSGTGALYTSYDNASTYNGNVTVNRTVAGLSEIFRIGSVAVTGNFSYTNNIGGNTAIHSVGATEVPISGTVNITATGTGNPSFSLDRIQNNTTGGTISVQNSGSVSVNNDTLLLSAFNVNGYTGAGLDDFLQNQITATVNISEAAGNTNSHYFRRNTINGNTTITLNSSASFYEGYQYPNTFNGNTTFISNGSGTLSTSYDNASTYNGNVTVNRTVAGLSEIFKIGAVAVNGNFSYTNNAGGNTAIHSLGATEVFITGTVNITATGAGNPSFSLERIQNNTTGGTISVQNSGVVTVNNDTLLLSAFNVNGYTGSGLDDFLQNQITGTVNISEAADNTNSHYFRRNTINGNTTITLNSSASFFESYQYPNTFNGNTTFISNGSGTLYTSYDNASTYNGNVTVNRTVAGTTEIFRAGAVAVNGNFSYTNNAGGNTAIHSLGATEVFITGTVNITATGAGNPSFSLERIQNNTTGGTISVQNSGLVTVNNDTLLLSAFNVNGYTGGGLDDFLQNQITGTVNISDAPGNTNSHYFRKNTINGNTTITNNSAATLFESYQGGNIYNGDVNLIRNNGTISFTYSDPSIINQSLTLNSVSGITFTDTVKMGGNTNAAIEQLGTQAIVIPKLVIQKTIGSTITLNDSVTVSTKLNFDGGNIISSTLNQLIFPDNATYAGASTTSHVVGAVSKIGNDAFTFPIGTPTSLNMVAMTAPADINSKFSAQHFKANPSLAGFDTSLHAGTLQRISGGEYWAVQRLNGTSTTTLTFSFEPPCATGPWYISNPALARIAHWTGATWENLGNGGSTGTTTGTITTGAVVTNFSPFAFTFGSVDALVNPLAPDPPPTVTINQAAAQPDPTSTSPINFTVVFNEPVTGFATGDVTLSGTAGATTAIVTGSGTTYNVAISGMTGSGTVIATILAGVAIDAGSNLNLASTSTDNTVTYDTPPTVTINQAAAQPDPTSASPINFTVVFNEPVTGFATGDVTLSGTAGATTAIVTGSGTTYNVAVSGMTGAGTVIANISAGVAIDAGGNPNFASTSTDNTVNYDPPPTVIINQAAAQPDPTSASPINFTVVFNEPVTGFATGDVTLSGTAGATTAIVTGSGTTYNVAVSGMTGAGTVIANISAGVAIDAGGNPNFASTSTDNTVNYDPPPTVIINQAAAQPDPTSASPINFTVVFNEPVTGFATGDVTLSGTAGATTAIVTGSGTTYNVAVSGMTGAGTVIANISAGVAIDAGGNPNSPSTSTDNTVNYNPPPTVTINQAAAQPDPTSASPINFTVVFNEPVTGFATGDVTLSGTAGATTAIVTGSGTTYNVAVSGMTGSGTVIANIPAGVAIDAGGAGNIASTSTDNTVTYDTPPTVTINQAAAQPDPTATSPINFTVVFNEPVTGFATGDIVLSGTAGATTAIVTGSGTTYNVAVSGMTANGTVIANILSGVAIDAGGNPNTASTSTDNTVTYTGIVDPPPTVTINQAAAQADPTATSPINFTVVFNEPVTGFATGDVVLSGTAGATTAIVTGSGTTYNVAVSGMTANGTVIANILSGVAIDAGGNPNTASTSTDNTVTYTGIVDPPPTVTINQAAAQADPTSASPINFTVVFNEPVTGFATGDVVLSGTAGATTAIVTGSGTTYNVAVSGMTANGTVIANILSGVAIDAGGNPNTASTSTDNIVTYTGIVDPPPTVTINQAAAQADPTSTSPINFTVVFNEPVTGFATGDVTLSGTAGATTAIVTGSGTTYNVAVSGMTANGTVIANILASVAIDAGGNPNTASTSTDNIVTYTGIVDPPPTVTINQAAAQADPTSASPINFTVVFNEPVTGFATGDIVLSGTAGATTAIVTGSGTTYNVAVSGMTANGTVIANILSGVAIDAGGNPNTASTSTDNTVTYTGIVDPPPTVTINQAAAQPDPTSASPINFTVVFNEPVTGFATGDVALSGTAGATTAIVTGSGTTYNVAVSGMTANGTVIANILSGVAIDAGGNPNTASTSTDNTVQFNLGSGSCTLTCPPNVIATSQSWGCGTNVIYPAATTTGNCGALTYSMPSGSWFDVGTTVVTVTSSTGASCSFTVTVRDLTNPIVNEPQDIYINAANNSCSRVVTFPVNGYDNCPGVTAAAVPPSGSVFNVGTTPVTITATDASGNTDSHTFYITVDDKQRPVITCPPNITVGTEPGICKAHVTLTPATATDNCSGVIVTAFRNDFKSLDDYYLPGTTTITWRATDASGNYRECDQKVTVKDMENPVISNVTVNPLVLWPPNHTMRLVNVEYNISDNCGEPTSTISVTSNEPISGTGPGDLSPDWQVIDRYSVKLRAERADNGTGRIYTIKITVKDASGNTTIHNVPVIVPLNNASLIEMNTPPKVFTAELTAQIMPNPTENVFNLVITGNARETVDISVFDITGREIQHIRRGANDLVRFGESLMKGTYIIEVRQGKNKVVLRGVKQ